MFNTVWFYFLGLSLIPKILVGLVAFYLFLVIYLFVGKIFRLFSLGLCILIAYIHYLLDFLFSSLHLPDKKYLEDKIGDFKKFWSSGRLKIFWPLGFVAAVVLVILYIAGFTIVCLGIAGRATLGEVFKCVRDLFKLAGKLFKLTWKLLKFAWK